MQLIRISRMSLLAVAIRYALIRMERRPPHHNEVLRMLDGLVQLLALDRNPGGLRGCCA